MACGEDHYPTGAIVSASSKDAEGFAASLHLIDLKSPRLRELPACITGQRVGSTHVMLRAAPPNKPSLYTGLASNRARWSACGKA